MFKDKEWWVAAVTVAGKAQHLVLTPPGGQDDEGDDDVDVDEDDDDEGDDDVDEDDNLLLWWAGLSPAVVLHNWGVPTVQLFHSFPEPVFLYFYFVLFFSTYILYKNSQTKSIQIIIQPALSKSEKMCQYLSLS